MGSERSWYVQHKGTVHGPFTSADLKQLADKAKITPDTLVRLGEDGTWVPAKKVKGLFSPQPAMVPTAAPQHREPAAPATSIVATRTAVVARPPKPVPSSVVEYIPASLPVPVVKPERVACPFCGEDIAAAAIKCRHCNEFLDGRPREQGPAPTQQVCAAPTASPNVNVVVQQTTVVNQQQARWSRGVAMLLSLFIPGLGQMYKGQIFNGLAWLIVTTVGYFFFILPGVALHLLCIIGAGMGDPYR